MSQAPPRRRPNAELRSREFLTEAEVASLIASTRKVGRHGARDAAMILLAFRHGLRVSELLALCWDQVDLREGKLFVKRHKNGSASTHLLHGPELRELRKLLRVYPDSPYLFVSERGGPLDGLELQEGRRACGR